MTFNVPQHFLSRLCKVSMCESRHFSCHLLVVNMEFRKFEISARFLQYQESDTSSDFAILLLRTLKEDDNCFDFSHQALFTVIISLAGA
jgi:hypothetical protein